MMGINECVICANFGIHDHVIVNTDKKKHGKFINLPITQTTMSPAKLKFVRYVGDCKWFMQTDFKGTRSQTKMLQAENRQKVDDLELIYLGKY